MPNSLGESALEETRGGAREQHALYLWERFGGYAAMLANRMMGDSDGKKDSIQDQSSEPHVVVECPSCCTKFAVETSLVASYEIPKFHCSRCDSVFELSARREQALRPALNDESQRWVLSDATEQGISPHGASHTASHTAPHSAPHNPFAQPQNKKETASALKPSDFTLGIAASEVPLEPRKPFAPLEERSGLALLGLRPSAAQAASSVLTRNETLTYIQDNITPDPTDDPFSLFDAPGAPITTAPAATPASRAVEQTQIDQPSAQRVAQTPLFETPAASAQPLIPVAPPENLPPQADAEVHDANTPVRRMRAKDLYRGWVTRLSPCNQGLVSLSTPIVVAFTTLFLLSYAARLAPLAIDKLFAATIPSFVTGKVAHVPPRELSIQEVSLEFEKTQSRETIAVVRGIVDNASTKTIGDVTIEALGFNSRGEVLIRAQAPLRSALAREKIGDLPLETVKKFQTSLSARNSAISQDEKVAFTVALLSDKIIDEDIAFFSARVFSVGEMR